MNVFPKKFRITVILAAAALFILAPRATAASPLQEIERLAPPRMAVCFFDGDSVADIVVNARGKLTFTYVDGKLAQALSRQRKAEYNGGERSGIPSQIFAYATKSKRKHALFIARVQALKGWTFDSSMLSVGGYTPVKGDIITGVAENPSLELRFGERDLAKGYNGFIGFFVPIENAKPGETIKLGYATDFIEWQVPDKNQ